MHDVHVSDGKWESSNVTEDKNGLLCHGYNVAGVGSHALGDGLKYEGSFLARLQLANISVVASIKNKNKNSCGRSWHLL